MTVAPRTRSMVPVALLVAACGGGAINRYSLPVGSDDAGAGSFAGGDPGLSGVFDASIEQDHVTVTFVTLTCAGDCADVEAVATGGHPPYAFAWDDGSTSASRRVCPTSTTSYRVRVSDTAVTGELARPAETVQVPLAANVLACPAPAGGGDAATSGCETILTLAPSGAVTGIGGSDAGAESCPLSATGTIAAISAAVAVQRGQEYELVENASGSVLLGAAPVWSYYASSSDCNSHPAGQLLGSMTFDPAVLVQSLCFRASADGSYVNWFSSAVAAGVANGTWQLCNGCSHGDASP
jgi:hypothetical protein